MLALIVLCFDQGSKYIALNTLVLYEPEVLLPFFNLTLARNTGAAFSFLAETGDWHHVFFLVFGSMMSVGIFIGLMVLKKEAWVEKIALSLILGGAVGNLVDRIRLGYVVDFLDLHLGAHHWPIFNIADSAISLGIVFLCIEILFLRNEKRS